MPTVKSFANCRIAIYFDDHPPPHFHVITADHREALVRISDGRILGGIGGRDIADALDWALLLARWKECNG